ncbi:MAG: (2Fe-2S)-binding protein [Deltaproteobacteria bacterium]|nr:(2Fe-2S)-binding protein [Deltaproteobacteria bacterium]
MTRYHLRNRLKKRVGRWLGRAPQAVERIEVTFVLPDGSEHTVSTEPAYTLHMASQFLETPIHAPCPDGSCGNCRVRILSGQESLRPPSQVEEALLTRALGPDRDPAIRLACHARLTGSGVRVQVDRVWKLEDVRGV